MKVGNLLTALSCQSVEVDDSISKAADNPFPKKS